MVLEPSEVSVCLQHPGFDIDLEVKADTATLYRVYLGRAELGTAMRKRTLTMIGPRARSSAVLVAGSPGVRSPRQPPGRRAPEGGVATRGYREGAGRTAAATVSSLECMSVPAARSPSASLQATRPLTDSNVDALLAMG